MPKTQTLEIAPIFHKRLSDPLPVQIVLIGLTLLFFVGFIFLPLSLIDISGPFITISILEKAFPQGLEAVKTPRRRSADESDDSRGARLSDVNEEEL